MTRLLRYAVQAACYAALAALMAWLSVSPVYEYAASDVAIIKVSFSHAAQRVTPCVQLTPEQIAALPPNRRRPAKCERERLPLRFELDVDGDTLLVIDRVPSGLWNDGPASIYESFELEPGSYDIAVRLRDSGPGQGWDYTARENVRLTAGRYTTITFRAESGGFEFR
ncbi:MAG: hypothetical protein R3358_10080 [Woeseiaceae bacterium]|nr:hypothetical protein [Woeseiaceae bacterium]